jgi:cysteine desulfurase
MNTVYFDNAATTPMRDEVIDAISDCMKTTYGNPSSTHSFGRKAKSLVENARKSIAKELQVSAAEIIFTSGGTEADNLIIQGAVNDLGVKHIITTRIEHHAVLNAVEYVEAAHGVKVSYLELDENGLPSLQQLTVLLAKSTEKTLVSLMHINNEIGNILDIQKVAELCQQNKALFHSDTVQSVGHYKMNLSELPVDFLAVAAHKFHGPKGVGFAFIRKGHRLKALIHGGAQERGHRAGTENVHNIVGMQKAFELAYEKMEHEVSYIKELKHYFIEQAIEHIPGVLFNGLSSDMEKSTYTLVNMSVPVSIEKAALMLFQLDLKGIACSKGSACQSGSDQGSFVLNAIYDQERLQYPGLRFSFSHYNTKAEIDYVISTLASFCEIESSVSLN